MSYEIELYDSKAAKNPDAAPADFLSRHEKTVWESFKAPKRRNDWMAGRIAAKRLLQRRLAAEGQWLSLQDIQIQTHPSGEPYVSLPQFQTSSDYYPISISHSGGLAACALAGRGARIGIDVETVELRSRSWLEFVAHETERFPGLESNPVLQTAIWTLKEAVMKVLGTGATVDFWDIRVGVKEDTLRKGVQPLPSAWYLAQYNAPGINTASLELHGKARQAWEKLGCPKISHKTTFFDSNRLVLSVAYTSRNAHDN